MDLLSRELPLPSTPSLSSSQVEGKDPEPGHGWALSLGKQWQHGWSGASERNPQELYAMLSVGQAVRDRCDSQVQVCVGLMGKHSSWAGTSAEGTQ